MILTITLNPSIDSAYFIDHFKLGRTNRALKQVKSVGGKGINAGRTAALSGSKVMLAGLLSGQTGEIVSQYLAHENLFDLEMLKISGETRHAITMIHDGDVQTEIIENGPKVSKVDVFELLHNIKRLNKREKIDAICIAGSVNTTYDHLYAEMLTYIKESISEHLPVFMDISGQQLVSVLDSQIYHPFFIKPNLDELSVYLDREITSKTQALLELQQPCFKNIHYILVSCGRDGAVCKVGNQYYEMSIPEIETTNPTGSGDASVGGFMHAVVKKFSLVDTLKYAMACGMSNAQHGEVGKINLADTLRFMSDIQVKFVFQDKI